MAANNQGGNKGGNQGNQGNKGGNQGGNNQSDTSNRGFASMDPQRQREIASEGGRAAHASGNAHEFTSEEARRAGSMSHKNDGNNQSGSGGGQQGGRSENQGGGSQQSGRGGNNQSSSGGGKQGGRSENQGGGNQASRGVQGGTPEQHARAGAQSHKNDKR
ncbi:KGG domain-containing protein [Telluria aromaticivorans]|uniref:Stress-induced protein n=1 Tax=Telluria aromaticivorans TaxID=2725995 RepID=A0A7Y2NYQ3_9BURK|nr:KGG domain-containing protein [Telluria aromaticivorans]NNG22303.1 stress-induced protein [Telluria aromaticivorans]